MSTKEQNEKLQTLVDIAKMLGVAPLNTDVPCVIGDYPVRAIHEAIDAIAGGPDKIIACRIISSSSSRSVL